MSIKEHINKYFTKKSKFGIASDIIFVAFIISLIIPQSRIEVIAFVNRIRVAVWNPSINENDKTFKLNEEDYRIAFEGLDGKKFEFSETRGKVIFLNLWATWCPPCIAEMPAIQELYDKYKNNDQIVFLLVSTDDLEKVSRFINKRGYTFPVYINHYRLPEAFSTNSVPTTFVISKSGEIVINQIGAANWSGEKMQGIIDQLISE